MSWAEVLAEALAVAPKRIQTLAADAQAGAPWRGELRICEPSASLRHAISAISRAAQTAAAAAGDSPLDELFSESTAVTRVSRPSTGWPAQCCDQRSNSARPGRRTKSVVLASVPPPRAEPRAEGNTDPRLAGRQAKHRATPPHRTGRSVRRTAVTPSRRGERLFGDLVIRWSLTS